LCSCFMSSVGTDKHHVDVNVAMQQGLQSAIKQDILHEWKTPPDGNCLFTSVAAMLRRTKEEDSAESKAMVQAVDEFLRQQGEHWTCETVRPSILRYMVASCALDSSCTLLNSAVANWIEIARALEKEHDRALMVEYEHVNCVIRAENPNKLTQSERRRLYLSMSRQSYWGEQVALQLLRMKTGIAYLVVDGSGSLLFQFDASETPPETGLFGVLHLSGRHYTPLSKNNRFLFTEDDLPFSLSHQLATMDVHSKLLSNRARDAIRKAAGAIAQ